MDDRHDSTLTINVPQLNQVIILLEQINNNVMLGLQNDHDIMAAIAALGSGDPAAIVKAVTDLNAATSNLKTKTDALKAALPTS